jgi:MFS transporter, DHA1 family, staphyloferrin A biosynthesis exporter
MARTLESFRLPEYRWFYGAMIGQMAGMNMLIVVRSYLAFDLTGSYGMLGLVNLVGALPMLFLAMFGGVFADRLPKRTVLVLGLIANMAIAGALAALLFVDLMLIEWLIVSALIQGVVMALMMPSTQAMIPDIVGRARMMNAVALNQAGMNAMRLAAPAFGGFIIWLSGFGAAFAVMAAVNGAAAIALLQVAWKPAVSAGAGGSGLGAVGRGSIADILEGVRYIWRDRVMRSLLLVSFVSAIFGMPYLFLLPGYVVDVFDRGDFWVGLIMSISAIGSLAGALVLASLPARHRGWLLMAGTMTLAVGLFLFPQTSDYWIASGFIIIVGVGSAFRQALSQGLLHSYVEHEYRGRVMSVFMTQFSLMQLGTFFIGVAAEFVGIRTAFAALGIGLMLVTAYVTVFVPRVRNLQ